MGIADVLGLVEIDKKQGAAGTLTAAVSKLLRLRPIHYTYVALQHNKSLN